MDGLDHPSGRIIRCLSMTAIIENPACPYLSPHASVPIAATKRLLDIAHTALNLVDEINCQGHHELDFCSCDIGLGTFTMPFAVRREMHVPSQPSETDDISSVHSQCKPEHGLFDQLDRSQNCPPIVVPCATSLRCR